MWYKEIKKKSKKWRDNMLFSERFEVEKNKIEEYGAIDISLEKYSVKA